ncbi:MAG: glycosyltransferase [Cytophagales bacterium]|nr:glycosyltransferase [Cytophagales bacterium]
MIFILIIFVIIQCIFWGLIFSKISNFQPNEDLSNGENKISIIICAHNEYENLKKLLPMLIKQDYHCYEIIIVNDKSTDDTPLLLESFSKQCDFLSWIDIKETPTDFQSKKYALTKGISQAKYDYVLLTDADCIPNSNSWIEEMAKPTSQYDVVLGYSPYLKENTILNGMIQLETLYTATQYLGLALAGKPYMGVGRNVLYAKKIFTQNKGFERHQNIVGGDDDLFINSVANAQNTTIAIHPNSFVYSVPKSTWKEWIIQKKRHLSVGKRYKFSHKIILSILHFSQLGFYLSFFIGLFLEESFIFCILLFATRNIVCFYNFYNINKRLGTTLNFLQIVGYEVLYTLYIVIVGSIASFQKRVRWK